MQMEIVSDVCCACLCAIATLLRENLTPLASECIAGSGREPARPILPESRARQRHLFQRMHTYYLVYIRGSFATPCFTFAASNLYKCS